MPTLTLTNLRAEYKTNPVGIDVQMPRLSWEIVSDDRGVKQTTYQIFVANNIGHLRSGKDLIWDSGKVKSDRSTHIEYQGPPLDSGQRVYWQVRIEDGRQQMSEWSDAAFWETGLLKPSDWKAHWIAPAEVEDNENSGPCPHLRNEFRLKSKIKSARAYVTALGLYELYINGERVGDDVFTPGWTSYRKRLQYQTYDVTGLLREGNNAAGAIVGDGWYRGCLTWNMKRNYYGQDPALLLQIHVAYEDGTSAVINTDDAWKTSTGPILESDIYNGEIYDARLEMTGWNSTDFDDSDWRPVKILKHDKKLLVSPSGPPVRKVLEIRPVEILKTPNGDTVYDMGQNMVGWIRLRVKGKAGDTVTLKHAEVLDKDGNLYIENLRKAQQLVKYTLKGGEEEIYEPRFTFQGFRYVAVRGYPGDPDLDSLTGIVIHSDMPATGEFSCSNELVNQLQHNIQWGQRGNFLDVPTDCPQRNERLGWTGDAQVFGPTACFNFDAAGFFTKWLKDLAADQYDNGSVPHVIPDVLWDERPDIPNEALETRSNMPPMPDIDSGASAAWADASVIVPWTLYLCYGDTRILEQQYDSMKRWVEYMRGRAGESYLWTGDGHYGDWLAFATTRSDYPGATTNKDLIATAYYAHSTRLLSDIAKILNKDQDSKKYAGLFDKIKSAFQTEYVSPNGRLMSDTQTAYALALAFDLLKDEVRVKAAEHLSEDVRKFGHITTGFVGANLINQVITDNGYIDLAYMLLNRTIYPSWLYPITMGATTIWERWDGMRPDGSFQDAEMNSFNHYAYGAIGDWLYRVVTGIGIDPERPGYKHIIIHPRPGGELTSAAASHQSMYGRIESSWKIENGAFQLTVSIPPNTTATICLETASADAVRESGAALNDAPGISEITHENGILRIESESGKYQFEYRL